MVKRRVCLIITVFLLVTACTVFAEKISLKLVDISLEDFIKFMSARTKTNIVYSKRDIPSSIKINLFIPEGVSERDLRRIFDAILRANGLVAINKEGTLVVLRSSTVRRFAGELWPQGQSYALVTDVIVLKNLGAYEAQKIVKHLLSTAGRVDVIKAINAVVLTDVKERVKKVRAFLKRMDLTEKTVVRVYHFDDVDSVKLASELKRFFAELSKRSPGFSAPVVVSESASNSVLMAFKKKDESYIEEVVQEVYQRLRKVGAQKVIYLKNAVAKNVYKVVSNLIAKDKAFKGVSVSYDESTNSIILLGKQALFGKIERLIQKLDVARKQVYIEALVVETSVSKLREFGVEWSAAAKASGGVGYAGTTTSGHLGAIESTILGEGKFTALPGGFTLGVLGDTVTYNGIKFATLGALLNAFKSDSGINIVSNPKIVTLDNQKATIFVGENRPYLISEKYDINGNPIYSYTYKDVGVKLNIWPHISGKKILLDVEIEVNKVSEEVARGKTVAPVTLTRKTKTQIALEDGQKILISGLIEDDASRQKRGVPLLSSIPILGALFRYESNSKSKTNLSIFLTVHMVKAPETLAKAK